MFFRPVPNKNIIVLTYILIVCYFVCSQYITFFVRESRAPTWIVKKRKPPLRF